MQIGSNSSSTAIIPFLLKEDNYEDWSIYVENYLLAQDLWGIVESEDSCSEDVGYWRKKNAAALHAIHTTSSPEIFAQIKKISSAKDAWNKLAKMHQEWKSNAESSRILKAADDMTENPHYVELKKSICRGDWDGVKQFFVFHKSLGTTKWKSWIRLIHSAIANKMLDICYDLLGRFPSLTVATDKEMQGVSPILALSRQPSAFLSGCRLQLWQRRVYHGLKVKLPTTSSGEVRIPIPHDQYLNKKNIRIQVFDRLGGLSLMLLNFLGIKQIYDLKLTHRYALLILHRMCNHVSTLKVQHHFDCGVVDAMFEATKQGIVELVVELLKVSQPLIYYNRDRRQVFMVAIQHRQENVFNRFYGIHEEWKALLLAQHCRCKENYNGLRSWKELFHNGAKKKKIIMVKPLTKYFPRATRN
ncbi:hypothetical protein SLA2020_408160 [Shorea laevis]